MMGASTSGGRRRARRVMSRTGAALLLVIVIAAASPRAAFAGPISHAAWARLLVEAMGLADAVDPTGKDDAAVMEFLAGSAAAPIRVWGVTAKPFPDDARRLPEGAQETKAWVQAGQRTVTARYRVRIPQPGIYALRSIGAGEAQRWRLDGGEARLFRPSGSPESVGADETEADLLGYFLLAAGTHEVTVEVPPGGILRRFDLLRQPFPHVRPPGGWRADARLTFGDKAVTMIQAMQIEHELPDVSRWRVQREGERYDSQLRPALRASDGTRDKPSAGAFLKGAADGSRVGYRLEIPHPGTYTLLARVTGTAGGRLLLNRAVERAWPAPRSSGRLVWNDLATLPLDGGAHDLDVRLDAGGGLDLLRLVYRDPSPEAALMLLEDLGFQESAADEYVSLAQARANLDDRRFLDRVNTLVAGYFTQPGPGIGPGPGPASIEPPGLVLPSDPEPPDISP